MPSAFFNYKPTSPLAGEGQTWHCRRAPGRGDGFGSGTERGMEEAAAWGRAGGRRVSEVYGPEEPWVG